MLKVSNLSKSYGNRTLFKDFNYEFPKTGLVAIIGESGSGKSTLLNMISSIDKDYLGTILLDGKAVSKLSKRQSCLYRLKKIGYVFQNFNLIQLDTVFNNVYLSIDSLSKSPRLIKKKRVQDCLKLVGLSNYQNKNVNKLSGGEKQRVAIARSIINDPDIILCDEPTGSLDEKNGEIIFRLLRNISNNKLVIIATHDIESIKKIANIILSIKNETIEVKETGIYIENNKLLIMGRGKPKLIPRVSLGFKIRYGFQKIKSKKYRSLITNLMLSLSLSGIGISLLIKDSISTKVTNAFESILNGNQIVVSMKNDNNQSISQTYSASFENVEKVYKKYQYHFEGIGVNYLVNFEDFFKDKNSFYISTKNKEFELPSLSARNINEYSWLNEDTITYPYQFDEIDDDQIILGLSHEDMINVCYQLQIQRNFTSLGHYIYEKGISVVAMFANNLWEYDDEQIFNIVGVCESRKTSIYHSNKLWNEYVFEEMMRIPSDDDNEHKFPWEMLKLYYLQTSSDPSYFLNSAFYDSELDDYVFERNNYQYNPSICSAGEVCNSKRMFVYFADKYCVSPSIVKNIENELNNISTYYFTSDYGYASFANNMFSGFSKNVFVSLEDELINDAIDADTQLNNESNIEINLPFGVIQGNYLNSLSNGLRFSTRINNLTEGRLPTNNNEIVISSGLAKNLSKTGTIIGKYLSFAGEINEIYNGDGIVEKDYNKTKLLIVGINAEEKNYIYNNSMWTISFFRDKLGVSNFLLAPKQIVFEFGNKNESEVAYKKMQKIIHDYKIENPLNELNKSVESTLSYANTILIAFSILSTIISILLLWTVLMLNIIESRQEINLFNYIGINNYDINSIFTTQGMLQGFLAFIVSAFELIIVDALISAVLSKFLLIDFVFSVNANAILIILLFSLLMPFIVSKIILIFMIKSKN